MAVVSAWVAALALAAQAAAPARSATHYITSKDGTRIAYDVGGSGPVLMLLHGGGGTRRDWHNAGYVARLSTDFTVVTIDIRGNGESDKPLSSSAYAIDKLTSDVLAVADAVGADRFALWGFSYGANIGRYLAARTDRVRAMAYIGIPFGAAASGEFRQMIEKARDELKPTDDDVRRLQVAWLSAMLEYQPVEPADMKCPTLWLVGTKNAVAMASVAAYRERLAGTRVTLTTLDDLTHPQEFSKIEQAFPIELAFTRAHP
jgi:pimeloyl-ACP methyl ester carboxylesterase